jgi:hypothetical protein
MHVVITPKYDGSHGYDVAGPFDSEADAKTWLAGREGLVKPLVEPEAHLAHRADVEAHPAQDEG